MIRKNHRSEEMLLILPRAGIMGGCFISILELRIDGCGQTGLSHHRHHRQHTSAVLTQGKSNVVQVSRDMNVSGAVRRASLGGVGLNQNLKLMALGPTNR
jgi:hypothetical protein